MSKNLKLKICVPTTVRSFPICRKPVYDRCSIKHPLILQFGHLNFPFFSNCIKYLLTLQVGNLLFSSNNNGFFWVPSAPLKRSSIDRQTNTHILMLFLILLVLSLLSAGCNELWTRARASDWYVGIEGMYLLPLSLLLKNKNYKRFLNCLELLCLLHHHYFKETLNCENCVLL